MSYPIRTQRIEKIIEYKGFNKVRPFSLLLSKTSYNSINRLFNHDTRTDKYPEPSIEILEDIAKTYHVSLKWLLYGEGEMMSAPTENIHVIHRPQFMEIPLIGIRARAGYLRGYGDIEHLEEMPRIPFLYNKDGNGNFVAFEVDGDSMENGTDESIHDGDILMCREIQRHHWADCKLNIRKWNFVIVSIEGITVKRIAEHNVETGILTLHSLNPFYEDYTVHVNDIHQIFSVVSRMGRIRI